MKGSIQFTNLFLPPSQSRGQQFSHQIQPVIRESHGFTGVQSIYIQNKKYSQSQVNCAKNNLIQQRDKPQSNLYGIQRQGMSDYSLQRSKSQIIQPIYYFSPKNNYSDNLNQSKQLASSKVSQITFSKPSKFITNLPRQNNSNKTQNQSFVSTHKNVYNDYQYRCNKISFNQLSVDSHKHVLSPMKQSYISDYSNSLKSSVIINPTPQLYRKQNVSNRVINFSPCRRQMLPQNKVLSSLFKPQLKRALSSFSVISTKGQSSTTKIRFNYISPVKSQSKIPRKLSFKKDDVKNPVSKLLNKKKELKSKTSKPNQDQVDSQVVNQYFPQFKIKKNKIKIALSPKHISNQLSQKGNLCGKSDISEDNDKRDTFIAGLQAFSQISQIRQKQRQQFTQLLTQTPKKCIDTEQYNQKPKYFKTITFTTNKSKNSNTGCLIDTDQKKVQITNKISRQVNLKNDSSFSKDSQISLDSYKNPDDAQFLKLGHDSSHTTDYEDQIVKKIKKDLGLNYSYYKE